MVVDRAVPIGRSFRSARDAGLCSGSRQERAQARRAGSEEQFELRLRRGLIANDGGASVSLLVTLLENQLGRRVFDETGLTGTYKFNLTLEPPRPRLFTALQEQLGLTMEVKRRPIEVLIVDRLERPSEN